MVTLDLMKVFVASLKGRPLLTSAQKKPFTVAMAGNRFEFVPTSTGKVRPSTDWHEAKAIFDIATRTGDRRPSAYQKMSGNASYVLALLEHDEASQNG